MSDKGRFGSCLAVLPDLNTDALSDLAVGAPLENDGHGSIYIFHGERQGKISPTYSQVSQQRRLNRYNIQGLMFSTVFKIYTNFNLRN